ncbi:hypothetical protein SAMN05660293_01529 [Dyadobacter psychrophilus]|uniref:HTH cro/C1-type domain-containing protein n=2 Tax=Dyadobacter psychrophilus TaxID=651661 RepID=A0A1T5DCI2_9BACT|nr:hypothetical protein SAMN05660293_01529 [Dyadobacter psychrophilus]
MLSKIERGERHAKKEHIAVLSSILRTSYDDLLSLWLADKVYEVVKNEELALIAIEIADRELRTMINKK